VINQGFERGAGRKWPKKAQHVYLKGHRIPFHYNQPKKKKMRVQELCKGNQQIRDARYRDRRDPCEIPSKWKRGKTKLEERNKRGREGNSLIKE